MQKVEHRPRSPCCVFETQIKSLRSPENRDSNVNTFDDFIGYTEGSQPSARPRFSSSLAYLFATSHRNIHVLSIRCARVIAHCPVYEELFALF